jgi:hypothetical protein
VHNPLESRLFFSENITDSVLFVIINIKHRWNLIEIARNTLIKTICYWASARSPILIPLHSVSSDPQKILFGVHYPHRSLKLNKNESNIFFETLICRIWTAKGTNVIFLKIPHMGFYFRALSPSVIEIY